MTFQQWWTEHGTLDYDEMCVAKAAWDYQNSKVKAAERQDGMVQIGIDELASIRTSLKMATSATNPHVEYLDMLITAAKEQS